MEIQNNQVTEVFAGAENNNINTKRDTHKESPTAAQIQAWLVSYLAEQLEIAPDRVDVTIPFERYGLDSSATVMMIGSLENWLESEIDPMLPYTYFTIEALSRHLGEEFKVD